MTKKRKDTVEIDHIRDLLSPDVMHEIIRCDGRLKVRSGCDDAKEMSAVISVVFGQLLHQRQPAPNKTKEAADNFALGMMDILMDVRQKPAINSYHDVAEALNQRECATFQNRRSKNKKGVWYDKTVLNLEKRLTELNPDYAEFKARIADKSLGIS